MNIRKRKDWKKTEWIMKSEWKLPAMAEKRKRMLETDERKWMPKEEWRLLQQLTKAGCWFHSILIHCRFIDWLNSFDWRHSIQLMKSNQKQPAWMEWVNESTKPAYCNSTLLTIWIATVLNTKDVFTILTVIII